MKKHAYCIMANSNLQVLKYSVKLIDDIRNDLYIVFDKKAKISPSVKEEIQRLCKHSSCIFLEDVIINWVGFSQVSAVLTLLKTALAHKPMEYTYIYFLQGADLPIKSHT